jgi:hypothetical protein
MPDGPARDSKVSLRTDINMENRDPTISKVNTDNSSPQVCSQAKTLFKFLMLQSVLNQVNVSFLHRPPASRRQAACTGRATFRPPSTETGRASYCPDPEDLQNELLAVHFLLCARPCHDHVDLFYNIVVRFGYLHGLNCLHRRTTACAVVRCSARGLLSVTSFIYMQFDS